MPECICKCESDSSSVFHVRFHHWVTDISLMTKAAEERDVAAHYSKAGCMLGCFFFFWAHDCYLIRFSGPVVAVW
jgi:hypothetical protein